MMLGVFRHELRISYEASQKGLLPLCTWFKTRVWGFSLLAAYLGHSTTFVGLFCFADIGFDYIDQVVLELVKILLFLPNQCWITVCATVTCRNFECFLEKLPNPKLLFLRCFLLPQLTFHSTFVRKYIDWMVASSPWKHKKFFGKHVLCWLHCCWNKLDCIHSASSSISSMPWNHFYSHHFKHTPPLQVKRVWKVTSFAAVRGMLFTPLQRKGEAFNVFRAAGDSLCDGENSDLQSQAE